VVFWILGYADFHPFRILLHSFSNPHPLHFQLWSFGMNTPFVIPSQTRCIFATALLSSLSVRTV
jgi:hypothetical protein